MTMAASPSPSGFPRFQSAARVLRILGIPECPGCGTPASEDFTFHGDIDELIICPACMESIDITGKWMVKAYEFLELMREAKEGFNSAYIKRVLKILVLCTSNENAIPLLTDEIERIGNEHVTTAWKDTLSELLGERNDDELKTSMTLGDLWDMKEGAQENGEQ
jgi:hypothetical protein